jgi:hypothetical protein
LADPGWAAALDDLEGWLTTLPEAEWVAPAGLGPLPAELAPRARAIVAAQVGTIVAGQAELERVNHQIGGLRRPGPRLLAEPPVYIDTVA